MARITFANSNDCMFCLLPTLCAFQMEMLQTELCMSKEATLAQLTQLRAERNELKRRLHEVVCQSENVTASIPPPTSVLPNVSLCLYCIASI